MTWYVNQDERPIGVAASEEAGWECALMSTPEYAEAQIKALHKISLRL